jgi:hypothetical protein
MQAIALNPRQPADPNDRHYGPALERKIKISGGGGQARLGGVGLVRDVPRNYVLIGPLSAGTLGW